MHMLSPDSLTKEFPLASHLIQLWAFYNIFLFVVKWVKKWWLVWKSDSRTHVVESHSQYSVRFLPITEIMLIKLCDHLPSCCLSRANFILNHEVVESCFVWSQFDILSPVVNELSTLPNYRILIEFKKTFFDGPKVPFRLDSVGLRYKVNITWN